MLFILLLLLLYAVQGLSTRSYLVTGANKGQGFALCKRILSEFDDTRVFLCARNLDLGKAAAEKLPADRVNVVQLDVRSEESVQAALQCVREKLGDGNQLDGLISNAGILWGFTIDELMQVNCLGVRRLLDAFLPIVKDRVVVVSTGLSPLMLSYSEHSETLLHADSWETIAPFVEQCLTVKQTPAAYEQIGFSGGPFAESVPDFHHYGLSKMFADAYMLVLSKKFPNLLINSVDPGLTFTDLILAMPKYEGRSFEETGAQTPEEAVEVDMRVLFDENIETGQFWAIQKKTGELKHGDIDKRPDV